jgi:demethylmenaquinone methyltransferase/2-methoxy-6-polyprenyl-1,4-benzoquinol methylase
VPEAEVIEGDALPLPFSDAAFERVFSSHFYDHLRPEDRRRFLAEAARVAAELIVVQQSEAATHREGEERRALQDGSTHRIYKVYFTPESLLAELGSGRLLYRGPALMVACRGER